MAGDREDLPGVEDALRVQALLHRAQRVGEELRALLVVPGAVVAAERVSPAVVSVSVVTTRVVRSDPFGGAFHDEFFDLWKPHERESVARHRREIAGILQP